MGDPFVQMAILLVAFGLYSWLSAKGDAEKARAEARLQEAKNAAQEDRHG